MKFLFWNIKKNSIGRVLSDIVEEQNVEVVILAECSDEVEILSDINAETEDLFHLTASNETRVVIYTRFSDEFIQSEYNNQFLTVRRVNLPGRREILLAAIHSPSKRHESYKEPRDRQKLVSDMSAKIREIESRVGHSRTVLTGDLNMNPFEEDMISANGWHAVMTQDIARKRIRLVQKESYPFFYNPMWGRFGDNTEGPPGTYHSRKGLLSEYFWHMWDQVLIRPDLLESFDSASLRVLEKCGGTSLVKRSGIPNARFSDHLPLLFALEI